MDYSFYNRVLIRTPLKPLKINFSETELLDFCSDKETQEALFLASPDLLSEFLKSTSAESFGERPKLVYSLLKYAIRMHTRCTPFGLFAGCGTAPWASEYKIEKNSFARYTRLDMMFAFALTQEITKLDFVKQTLKFYPNSSVYKIHDNIRYIEYYFKNKKRIYNLCQIDNSGFVELILTSARNGMSMISLSNLLVSDDISSEEAMGFINQLIDSQLLVSELDPGVTGEEHFSRIIKHIKSIAKDGNAQARNLLSLLIEINKLLQQVDTNIGNNSDNYKGLIRLLETFNIPYDAGKLFQTDLYKAIKVQNELPEGSAQIDLLKAIKILNKLMLKPERTRISEFKDAFLKRYGSREVPLLEVLDNESGLGYSSTLNNTNDESPLIDGFKSIRKNNKNTDIAWDNVQSYLLKKIIESGQFGKNVVNIEESELTFLEDRWDDLPVTMSMIFQHVDRTESGNKYILKNIGSPSAIHLLGRFSKDNYEVNEIVKDLAQLETNHYPNQVIAQIAHLPENRLGNVLFRPIIRDYEIPYLCGSQLPIENQIPVNDLFVSLRDGKIILKSGRLNKEIIPRLDNAHNYTKKPLPVYLFLCDLQAQNLRSDLSFSWGSLIIKEFKYLPRVQVGNIIVSLATWQLDSSDYEKIIEVYNDQNIDCFMQAIKDWGTKYSIPSIIKLVDGDNDLVIDLDDKLSCSMFVSTIRQRPSITLMEFLFNEANSLVKDDNGRPFNNEMVGILVKNVSDQKLSIPGDSSKAINIQRDFTIGSEWLYYNIYCGVKNSDEVLLKNIAPLAQNLLDRGLVDHWFFVRYGDPEYHLRFRAHLREPSKIGLIIETVSDYLNEPLLNGVIWKIQADTYTREVERYGESTMVLSEKLFFYDSLSTVKLMTRMEGNEDLRWKFALISVDNLLSSFKFTISQKKDLLESLKNGFAKEFAVDKYYKLVMDKKYRENTAVINSILNSEPERRVIFRDKDFEQIWAPVFLKIATLVGEGEIPLTSLVTSYIHMSLNRIFRNNQRLHELVIYDFLWRYYRSEIAKTKNLEFA